MGRNSRARTAAISAALLLAAAPSAGRADPLPGAPEIPDPLAAELAAAVAARGKDYQPRTRNRHPDGSPMFTNRLVLETSPYLQQHAHNPVNWYPWGDAAFAAARTMNRPVLLSIGYSTCHWCHVMEEESFDDPALAAFLNAHFIAIKVDREARPDIDSVYMTAVHAMNQSGGWPLNVWLTPERKPFYGGTYFPPENRHGRPGFRSILETIRSQYAQNPGRVGEVSDQITSLIARQLEGGAALTSQPLDRSAVDRSASETTARIDRTWGGIGRQTKFPSTVPVRLLLRVQHRTGAAESRRLVELTLDRMAAGGIRDHIGGGFHRYSTEPRWLVPHFEMMLYDNALIASTYIEAYRATGRDAYARIAADTLDYLLRDMRAPKGGFYSATDADSLRPDGHSEEGYYFTWSVAEIDAALGERDSAIVKAHYGVSPEGNFEGRNILHTWTPLGETAASFETTEGAIAKTIEATRSILYAAREKRIRPARDEKILAGWNGLAISALARVGFAQGESRYTQAAAQAAAFVLDTMRENGRLHRVYKDGRSDGPAFLEDYAFLIAGLLDLYEADANPRWLREAIALQATLDQWYADDEFGGYFKTANDQEALLAREKPASDGAVPSGNGVAAMNLLRLAEFTTDSAHEDRALQLFAAFHDDMSRRPTRLPEMLMAVEFFLSANREIVVVRPRSGDGSDEMLSALRNSYTPNSVQAVVREGDSLAEQSQLVPLLVGRTTQSGRTTAYVCENRVCQFPTTDPDEFKAQLRRQNGPK